MIPLTGTVGRPGSSIAKVRSVESWRPFCPTRSWGTVPRPGDTITKTGTGVITRPGNFVPKKTLIGGRGAVAWARS